MVATGGFGMFPENPLTQTFQQVLADNFSAEYLDPFNAYLDELSVPTIKPGAGSGTEQDPPFDPLGTLVAISEEEATPGADGTALVETAVASILETVTELAPSSTSTLIPTSTVTLPPLPSDTPPPSFTVSPVPSNTLAYTPPTQTRKPRVNSTKTLSLTTTVFPTLAATDTPTPVPASGGSCVTSFANTTDYDCVVSNVRLDGTPQTSLTVLTGQNFTFEYDFQVWAAPSCPGCSMQVLAGLESNPLPACDYSGIPGANPGASGASLIHTIVAPATPGSYAIFVRWTQQADCASATTNYGGFGTVIALITVQ